MGKIMNTVNHFRAYAFGESCKDVEPSYPHTIDLTEDDETVILKGLEILQLLAVIDEPDVDNLDKPSLELQESVIQYYSNLCALHKIAKEVDKS